MNETAICSPATPHGQGQPDCEGLWAAKRETFHSAGNPSGPMACRAGRKRPWKDGCGQSARMDTEVSAPSGAMAKASDPPSSSEKENGSVCVAEPCTSASDAWSPPVSAISPVPG